MVARKSLCEADLACPSAAEPMAVVTAGTQELSDITTS